jgi:hypothetical protein
MDSLQRRRVEDRTRGQHRVRVVTVIAAVGSGVLATVLSVLLTGTAATASTSTSSTGSTDTTTQTPTTQTQTPTTQTQTPTTQGNDDQLQAPTTTPTQTTIGGGHASSGGT